MQSFLILFEGDLTEDPEHPKIFWPSDENCPRCYNWKNKRSLDVDTGLALLISGKKIILSNLPKPR